MQISIGRIVIFHGARGEDELPAIVTRVCDEEAEIVDLQVFGYGDCDPLRYIHKLGSTLFGKPVTWGWSWPPKV